MDYFPFFFDLKAQRCLLVGGGDIAWRKADLLLRAGAVLRVVAPKIDPRLRERLESKGHELVMREFEEQDLDDVMIVVSATDNRSVNQQVSEAARRRNLPVNVVDQPDLCTIIFPAIVDRSPVVVAVSTGGDAPVLTRLVREMLEGLIGQGYALLGQFLGDRRPALKERYPNPDIRRRHTESFMSSPGRELAMQGRFEEADSWLNREADDVESGEVYLVGAGPGDPDLLTLRALQLMQRADVVLYDSLVPAAVLDRVRRDARREYVGKRGGGESTAQTSINELLVRYAHAGERVLRLKGGDPFVFGRGGEEIESLVEEGIPFQVVPGITAANGCAAYAGIPLTHRDYSQSVRFVTGHPKNGEVSLAWQEFAHPNQTIVFYMGLGGLEQITGKLIEHGRDPQTPVAIIAKGTMPEQEVVIGTLASISAEVRRRELERPTLTIVGEVVNLYGRLNPNV